MSKRTIEGRIEDYRIRNEVPADLDELLVDAEAEIYGLNRRVRVLEAKLKASQSEKLDGPKPAAAQD